MLQLLSPLTETIIYIANAKKVPYEVLYKNLNIHFLQSRKIMLQLQEINSLRFMRAIAYQL